MYLQIFAANSTVGIWYIVLFRVRSVYLKLGYEGIGRNVRMNVDN